jgi:hypothetical protein
MSTHGFYLYGAGFILGKAGTPGCGGVTQALRFHLYQKLRPNPTKIPLKKGGL